MLPDSRRQHVHGSSLAAAAVAYANRQATTCQSSPESAPHVTSSSEAPAQGMAGSTVPSTLIRPATADADPGVQGSSMADGMTSGDSCQQKMMGTEPPDVSKQQVHASHTGIAHGSRLSCKPHRLRLCQFQRGCVLIHTLRLQQKTRPTHQHQTHLHHPLHQPHCHQGQQQQHLLQVLPLRVIPLQPPSANGHPCQTT